MAKKKTWVQRFVDAKKRGKFTRYERHIAADWSRCAVGEQRRLPGGQVILVDLQDLAKPVDKPVDHILANQGYDFYGAVIKNDVRKARQIYQAIKARVEALKGGAFPCST